MHSSENSPLQMPQQTSRADSPPAWDCPRVLKLGPWERMSEDELRWRWTGNNEVSLRQLLGEAAEIHSFPSAMQKDVIHICVFELGMGGMISYERENGEWIHTVNGQAAFRYRVFELNLMPLEQLGTFLKRTDDDLTPPLPPPHDEARPHSEEA